MEALEPKSEAADFHGSCNTCAMIGQKSAASRKRSVGASRSSDRRYRLEIPRLSRLA